MVGGDQKTWNNDNMLRISNIYSELEKNPREKHSVAHAPRTLFSLGGSFIQDTCVFVSLVKYVVEFHNLKRRDEPFTD